MATTLKARVNVDFAADLVSALDLQTRRAPAALKAAYALTNGTGAGEADILWTDRRTIAASTTEDLDLTASLSDAFATSLTFARIKLIMVKAAAANTNNVHVGGDAAALVGWVGNASDLVVVRPGGMFLWVATDATAAAVTATTGDILQVANSSSGTSVTYDIALVGSSV